MSVKQRIRRLEALSPLNPKRIFIFYSDGVVVSGVGYSLAEYQRQFPDGPGAGDYTLRLPSLSIDDI